MLMYEKYKNNPIVKYSICIRPFHIQSKYVTMDFTILNCLCASFLFVSWFVSVCLLAVF